MKSIFFFTILLLLLLIPIATNAGPLVPGCATQGDGGICCALFMASNFARLLLGLVGAVALLMFIIGGFIWITSTGSAEKVKKGQSLMSNTLIGIVIVVVAWFAVNFIIISFSGQKPTDGKVILTGMDTAWYEICKGESICKSTGEGWSCQDFGACGLNSYTDCDAAKNCVRFLCSGGNNNVCCNPTMKTGLEK